MGEEEIITYEQLNNPTPVAKTFSPNYDFTYSDGKVYVAQKDSDDWRVIENPPELLIVDLERVLAEKPSYSLQRKERFEAYKKHRRIQTEGPYYFIGDWIDDARNATRKFIDDYIGLNALRRRHPDRRIPRRNRAGVVNRSSQPIVLDPDGRIIQWLPPLGFKDE